MRERELQLSLGLDVPDGVDGPYMTVDDDFTTRQKEPLDVPKAPAKATLRDAPSDPAHPWRDFYVQNGARRFLKEVVLPDWVQNHPHQNCSNIRVDEWGRVLCRYITPTQIGVDGPWENPTHFLMYAYNTFQTQQRYGITLNTFLRQFCDIQL